MLHYIYGIKNKVNGKYYIGLTNNAKRRRNKHFTELRCNNHYNTKLQRAFNKYGEHNFEFLVLLETNCSRDKINELEIDYVQKYKAYDNGYNLNRGGEQHNGFESRFSEENVFDILSAFEFSENQKIGGLLAEIFETTTTTIHRINTGMSHEDIARKYRKLPSKTRKAIYQEFEEFQKNKDKANIKESNRSLSEKEVLYILSVNEFDERRIGTMAKHFDLSSNVLGSILQGISYKDVLNKYNLLDKYEKMELYEKALEFFNFQPHHCRIAESSDILDAFCLIDMISATAKELSNILPLTKGVTARLVEGRTYKDVQDKYNQLSVAQKNELLSDLIDRHDIMNKPFSSAQKLTPNEVFYIIQLLDEGKSQQSIADQFGLARGSIQKLSQNETYHTILNLYDTLKRKRLLNKIR